METKEKTQGRSWVYDEPMDIRLTVRFSAAMLKKVDSYRRLQEDLPSRVEVIRKLALREINKVLEIQ